jgi:hypothetical protein
MFMSRDSLYGVIGEFIIGCHGTMTGEEMVAVFSIVAVSFQVKDQSSTGRHIKFQENQLF